MHYLSTQFENKNAPRQRNPDTTRVMVANSLFWRKVRFDEKVAKFYNLIGDLQRRKSDPYHWSGIL